MLADPFVPKSDGVTYQIQGSGSTDAPIPANNNFYTFTVIDEQDSPKIMLVKDAELGSQIMSMEKAQFLFDEQNVIVGIAE